MIRYNLETKGSDEDYTCVFTTPTRALLDRNPPQATFTKHVEAKFGANKGGEIEYAGAEMAHMLIALCKGNPVSLEVLFTDPARSVYEGPDWTALRTMRHIFLTQRCVNQYMGFIGDRLRRCRKLLARSMLDTAAGTGDALPGSSSADASKSSTVHGGGHLDTSGPCVCNHRFSRILRKTW